MAKQYDAIVIGTGQAGPALAGRHAGAGMKVAVIESKRVGSTSVNNGCVPTKTLVASARAAYMARRSGDYGVVLDGPVGVDMKKVKERKDQVVARSSGGLNRWLTTMENATFYHGHGRFEGPHTVRVGELLHADRIFINVGARASVPPVPGIPPVSFLNNSSIMDVDFLPRHLLVLGGGYIALEFGQMFRRFGSEVTIIQRGDRLLSREDEDISAAVRGIIENEGMRVCTNTGDFQIEKKGEEVVGE